MALDACKRDKTILFALWIRDKIIEALFTGSFVPRVN